MSKRKTKAEMTADVAAVLELVKAGGDSLGAVANELEARFWACACGHGKTPRKVSSQDTNGAVAEKWTGHRDGVGRCFDCERLDEYECRPGDRCRRYRQVAGLGQSVAAVATFMRMSRHEERADKILGLGREKVDDGERVPWLPAVTVAAWKAMPESERRKKMLEGMDRAGEAAPVEEAAASDAPVVTMLPVSHGESLGVSEVHDEEA